VENLFLYMNSTFQHDSCNNIFTTTKPCPFH
jgi:hypothetical protein